jgi:hypothetical protein
MRFMHHLAAIGHQLHAWTLGIILTLVFLDAGPGLWRDHPPESRRIAGLLGGLLGFGSIVCVIGSSWRDFLMMVAPFSVMTVAYGWAWWSRAKAEVRRRLGWQTAVLGGLSLMIMMLCDGSQWHGGIVIGAYGATAGLLGGFTIMALLALADPVSTDMPLSETPYGVAMQVALVGMGLTLLGSLDAFWNVLSGAAGGEAVPVLEWVGLSLLVPFVLMAAAHKLFPRFQRVIWVGALVSAVCGQIIVLTMLEAFAGVVPPPLI